MPALKLKEFLDAHGVNYTSLEHPLAYTAPEVAQSAHISGTDFAKTVIVKLEGELAMVILPANRKVVLAELRDLLETDSVELAAENEFRYRFSDCELGAMPAFGNLYGFPVYIERHLAEHETFAFNAGSHHEVMRMRTRDFIHLVNPMIIDFVGV